MIGKIGTISFSGRSAGTAGCRWPHCRVESLLGNGSHPLTL